jgi:hypothetical protein
VNSFYHCAKLAKKAQELIRDQFAILLYKEEVPRHAHVISHHVTFRHKIQSKTSEKEHLSGSRFGYAFVVIVRFEMAARG